MSGTSAMRASLPHKSAPATLPADEFADVWSPEPRGMRPTMGTFIQIAIACIVFATLRVFLSLVLSLGMMERAAAGLYAPLPYTIIMTVPNALKSFLVALVAVLCSRVVGDVATATATTLTLTAVAFFAGMIRVGLGREAALAPGISFIAALISTGVTYGAIVLGARLTIS